MRGRRVRVREEDGQQGWSDAGPQAKKYEETLQPGKGKEISSPIQPPKKHSLADPFILAHFCFPEL